jgi:outer membrane protein TolC
MVEISGMKEAGGPMNSFMLGGSIPLELYHRRERRVEVATSALDMARFAEDDVERRLRGEVESKFGDALAALRNLQFIEELLALNRQALALSEARAGQGAGPQLDADLVRVEVNRIDSLRADYEARLAVALLELKSLVGMAPEEDLRLGGTLDPLPFRFSQTEATVRALQLRPDLLKAREAERLAEAKRRQAETEGRPDASLWGNYQRSDNSFNLNGLTAGGQIRPIQGIFHLLTLGVSISLPARNRNEGMIAAAAAEQEQARRRREYAELLVQREVAAAFVARDKAKESLDIYSRGVREQARRNLEVIRRVQELGRSQLLDVIGEQRRFIDVETGYTEALNRYYQAVVRLRTVAGVDRP